MATPATAVVYSVNACKEKKRSSEETLKKKQTACFCCQAVVGWSFMSFEAGDVVVVIYSFHYQGFTPLLVPNRHTTHTHTHTHITVEACTLPVRGETEVLNS